MVEEIGIEISRLRLRGMMKMKVIWSTLRTTKENGPVFAFFEELEDPIFNYQVTVFIRGISMVS